MDTWDWVVEGRAQCICRYVHHVQVYSNLMFDAVVFGDEGVADVST